MLTALADAGIGMDEVEFLACGNFGQANASYAQRILQTVEQTGIPAINVANACATGSTAFREAYLSVGAGVYDIGATAQSSSVRTRLLGRTRFSAASYTHNGVAE